MDNINLPETLDVDPTAWGLPQATPDLGATAVNPPEPSPEELVHLLYFPSHREDALSQLVKVLTIYYDLIIKLVSSLVYIYNIITYTYIPQNLDFIFTSNSYQRFPSFVLKRLLDINTYLYEYICICIDRLI